MTYAPIHPPLSTLLNVYSKSSRNKQGPFSLPIENFLLNKTLQTFDRRNIWPFQKDAFVEISHTKQAECVICMVRFRRDPVLSGVGGSFISRGVLSGSHVCFRARGGSKPGDRVAIAWVAAGSTATARTNPTLSGPESSGAARRAAMNHQELNDLQIYGEKAAGTSRVSLSPGPDPFDLALRLTQQTKRQNVHVCASIREGLQTFEPQITSV